MNLSDVIVKVQEMFNADSFLDVEKILADGLSCLDGESDIDVIVQFADLCHGFGDAMWEVKSLRKAISLCDREVAFKRGFLERLLFSIVEIRSDSDENVEDVKECVDLATELINYGATPVKLLHYHRVRGRAYLKLGSQNNLNAYKKAEEDFLSVLKLFDSKDLPEYWKIKTMKALATVDLAESTLLQGEKSRAADLLDQVIETMNELALPNFLTAYAHKLRKTIK